MVNGPDVISSERSDERSLLLAVVEMTHIVPVQHLDAGAFDLLGIRIAAHVAAAHVEAELVEQQSEPAHAGSSDAHQMDIAHFIEIDLLMIHLGFPFQAVRLHKTL